MMGKGRSQLNVEGDLGFFLATTTPPSLGKRRFVGPVGRNPIEIAGQREFSNSELPPLVFWGKRGKEPARYLSIVLLRARGVNQMGKKCLEGSLKEVYEGKISRIEGDGRTEVILPN